jgi:glutamine synthetase
LEWAGVEPETFEPEFGTGQFEICCTPAEGLAAADRIVVMRETIRAVAGRRGLHASLSPLTAVGVPGNGAHLHFSFVDAEGRPATHDPSGHGGLSATAAAFAAGVVAHMPALCAMTAPAPVSYKRIGPHHWSSGYACLGGSNREAGLRIVEPRLHADDANIRGLHLEYRPVDSTCSPYLALGMLVHAGLHGIRENLPPPPLVTGDPDDLSPQDREAQGIVALPSSLEAALEALTSDTIAVGWLPSRLRDVYVSVKRKELEMTAGLGEPDLLAKYANAY